MIIPSGTKLVRVMQHQIDALSIRKLELATLTGVTQPIHKYVEEMQKDCLQDVVVATVMQELQQGSTSQGHYTLVGTQLYYKGRVYVPQARNWRDKIIKELHEGLIGGHTGRTRTY